MDPRVLGSAANPPRFHAAKAFIADSRMMVYDGATSTPGGADAVESFDMRSKLRGCGTRQRTRTQLLKSVCIPRQAISASRPMSISGFKPYGYPSGDQYFRVTEAFDADSMNLPSGARGERVAAALAIISLIKPLTFAEGSSPFVRRGITPDAPNRAHESIDRD